MNILLLGCGKMGGAMARAWLPPNQNDFLTSLTIIKPSPVDDPILLNDPRCHWAASITGQSPPDVLVLGIKPQIMADIVPSCRAIIGPDTIVISLAAGKTLASLKEWLGPCAIVRTMPNTPAAIGHGVTAAIATPNTTTTQKQSVETLLSAIGMVEWLDDENQMDAVTAMSGSGPAYVFLLIEAMTKAGESLGLNPDMALRLAQATVQGSGNLAAQSLDHPTKLRQNVTSPGGTTAAALAILMATGGMPDLLQQAMRAAVKRAGELAQP